MGSNDTKLQHLERTFCKQFVKVKWYWIDADFKTLKEITLLSPLKLLTKGFDFKRKRVKGTELHLHWLFSLLQWAFSFCLQTVFILAGLTSTTGTWGGGGATRNITSATWGGRGGGSKEKEGMLISALTPLMTSLLNRYITAWWRLHLRTQI